MVTGGLGPTPDDLTHEAIASYFGVSMVEHPHIWQSIQARFAERGRVASPSNRKQACLPEGAQELLNSSGSAPGLIWEPRPDLILLTFPGVPREMQQMWRDVAVPYLKSRGWGHDQLYSRVLRYWGIAESALAERVGDRFNATNPTVAPYAGQGEVRLRLTARAQNPAEAAALLEPVARDLVALAPEHYFGSDEATLASVVGSLLQERHQTLAVAESCTGGLVGQLITAVPGSSAYFQGSVVAYANSLKTEVLGVSEDLLLQHGAVSEAIAIAMAVGAQRFADWGLAVTGIAGPQGATETKAVGDVFVAVASPDREPYASAFHFGSSRDGLRPTGGHRDWIRWLSAQTALNSLRLALL